MIRVRIRLGTDGLLRDVTANGHSGRALSGGDIVCAAATALLRTAARILEESDGIEMSGRADAPGSISFTVSSIEPAKTAWLSGVGAFLIRGIEDLCDEYPADCSLEISGAGERQRR